MSKEIIEVHYNQGCDGIKMAFIFSCPGRCEEECKKPVVGETGANLEILLAMLNQQNFTLFPYTDRYKYRITNVWATVEYVAKTDRSEPKLSEIKNPLNIQRIKDEIQNMNYAIFFGKKAQSVLKSLNLTDIKIISVEHTGVRGLNSIRQDIYGSTIIKSKSGNTFKRIEVIAQKIIDQIGNIK